jgi:hypothetical protein
MNQTISENSQVEKDNWVTPDVQEISILKVATLLESLSTGTQS